MSLFEKPAQNPDARRIIPPLQHALVPTVQDFYHKEKKKIRPIHANS